MANLDKKIHNITNKMSGQIKEKIGDITDNEELKLKGKIQTTAWEIKENIDDKMDDVKENIAGKINELLDKNKNNE